MSQPTPEPEGLIGQQIVINGVLYEVEDVTYGQVDPESEDDGLGQEFEDELERWESDRG